MCLHLLVASGRGGKRYGVRRAAHPPHLMAGGEGFRHKAVAAEAVRADDEDFGLAHGNNLHHVASQGSGADGGVAHGFNGEGSHKQAKAAVGIIACPLASPVANSANRNLQRLRHPGD